MDWNFLQQAVFPSLTSWKDFRILNVSFGSVSTIFTLLKQNFPGSDIKTVRIDNIDTFFDQEPATENNNDKNKWDYILVLEPGLTHYDLKDLLGKLPALLKPTGIIAAHVYGLTGYYGLNMVSTIIKKISTGIPFSPENPDMTELIEITRSVVSHLPANHPASRQKAIMEKLANGDPQTIEELLHLSPGNIYTVPQIIDMIADSGGRLVNWVNPTLYDPTRYIENRSIAGKLKSIPQPLCWEIAELINALPADHYFFVGLRTPGTLL